MERGLIDASVPTDKTSVRDHLRSIGREDDWTELQGVMYGPELHRAQPYDGVLEFIAEAVAAGHAVFIISHKTRYPYRGEQQDLHAAALNWLEARGVFDSSGIALPRDHVFLNLTKHDKLTCIGEQRCDVFIDDLPEFLAEPTFPSGVRKVLFDPNERHAEAIGMERFASWNAWRTQWFDDASRGQR